MDHRFQIDLRGLIDLLSNHLYSSPDVFLRELLQNAVDAHTAMRVAGLSAATAGPGSIRVFANGDAELIIEDDGVGLTEDEVHRFLATIGQSSKRLTESPLARDFLGQFGIGLLACFVVSDTIEVHTRSARAGEAPILRWRGHADGTYALERAQTIPAIGSGDPTFGVAGGHGTRVYLRAKPGRVALFQPDNVRAALRRYGSLLPHRIELTTPAGSERIDAAPPWRAEHESSSARREAIMAYGSAAFGVDFFDYIPLASAAGRVDGVAYVLPHASATGARRADRVYLKGMLLSDKTDNLLPSWAFFVKAVVDVGALSPLASREAFFEDGTLEAARETLGACLKAYLLELSRGDRDRLHALIALHHYPIKQLAVEDPEFLALIARWLPFETSAGILTLEGYLRRSDVIRYARTVDVFRQVAPLVGAQGRCVINAGYVHDGDIIERFAAIAAASGDGPALEEIDAASLADSFAELSLDERSAVFSLLRVADLVLQPYKCVAQIKRFAPVALPALYSAGQDATFLRDVERSQRVAKGLWSSVLGELAVERGSSTYARMTLNYDNPMIRRLASVDDHELMQRLIEVLYVQTLLLGHHPLSAAEMNLVNESLTGLMVWSLDSKGPVLQ